MHHSNADRSWAFRIEYGLPASRTVCQMAASEIAERYGISLAPALHAAVTVVPVVQNRVSNP